jgi:hypothetical protein
MADIVNLRNFRKQRARSEKERRAEENRILHGTPSGERKRVRQEKRKQDAAVDAHRLAGTEKPDRDAGNGEPDA